MADQAYAEPPKGSTVRKWVPVAELHLPLSSGAVARVIELLVADFPSRELVLDTASDDADTLLVGYWTEVAL